LYKYAIKYLCGLFLLLLISCSALEINETTRLKVPASVKPGDCIACHESKGVLSQNHVDTRVMMGSECGTCHQPGPTTLRTKIPLSHIHQLKGLSCKVCHNDPASIKDVNSKVCVNCHDNMSLLIEATNDMVLNPHISPHEGMNIDCNRCHHQHKSSENYCNQCHNLTYKVP